MRASLIILYTRVHTHTHTHTDDTRARRRRKEIHVVGRTVDQHNLILYVPLHNIIILNTRILLLLKSIILL